MIKVGLTGGYATGKSFVAAEFERLGCHLIYADRLGHEVLLPTSEAYRPVKETFGDSILAPDGTIDRKKLGALVFSSPELLERLTAIIHPAVFRLEQLRFAEIEATHPHAIAMLEAAILVETRRYAMFDRLIVTTCDPETQIARGMKRDSLTREQVLARIGRQLPFEEKRKQAHHIIDTGGRKEDTLAQVAAIFSQLNRLAEAQE